MGVTAIQIFAFVILPLIVVAVGYAIMKVTGRGSPRRHRLHPGE